MAYIGRPLQVANLAVQSGTGDGSDTTPIATLDYATVTNGIAVYLDGVRQLAGTDFNVTAQTTLTFTTAPANLVGVDVYFLGLELSLPTPADGTVATAKIVDDAVTLAKMASGTDGNIISYDASGNPVAIATGSDGQVLTSTGAGSPPAFEAAPTSPVHYFDANKASSISVTDGVTTKVTGTTELEDSDGWYASDRFTPQVAGRYYIYGQATMTTGSASNLWHNANTEVRKNTTTIAIASKNNYSGYTGQTMTMAVGVVVQLNGSSDYIELFGHMNVTSGSPQIYGTANGYTRFGGFYIGA
mgnify:CR=1 FL=1